jgi:hypothetical protein
VILGTKVQKMSICGTVVVRPFICNTLYGQGTLVGWGSFSVPIFPER